MSVSLRENITAVIETCFSETKDGIQEVAINRILELIRADRKTEPMKTTDYCDICKRDMCEDCIADATNPYCVPSHYEINYESKDEPKAQIKTQNSNLTFEKDECAKEYEELGLKELKELINADRKTEPNSSEKPNNCEWSVEYAKEMLDTMSCEAFTQVRMVSDDDYCSYGEREG